MPNDQQPAAVQSTPERWAGESRMRDGITLAEHLARHDQWRRGGKGGARANLAGANLAGANLADADLAGAYLADAYLAGADLADAYLADANSVPSIDPAATKPTPATEAEWRAKRLERQRERALRFRERNPEIPVVENLDAKILRAIEVEKSFKLDMGQWHGSCGTTHCRAGSAIHLAGEAGRKLEEQVGPERAGALIYRASTGRVPHFYGSNEAALEDIKRCAAEQQPTPAP